MLKNRNPNLQLEQQSFEVQMFPTAGNCTSNSKTKLFSKIFCYACYSEARALAMA